MVLRQIGDIENMLAYDIYVLARTDYAEQSVSQAGRNQLAGTTACQQNFNHAALAD